MADSFGFRQDHLMNFMKFAELSSIDPFEIFAASRVNCLQDAYKNSCGVSWLEYDFQGKNKPSRMSLANKLYQAETMIGQFLKTPVGPTYIKGEMHTVHNHSRHRRYAQYNRHSHVHHDFDLRINTRWRNVLKTGTQVLTRIGENLTHTRTFNHTRNWDLGSEDIIYCIGSAADPLNCGDVIREYANLCNLRVYQPGYGPLIDGGIMVNSNEYSCFTDDCGTQYTIGTADRLCYQDSLTSDVTKFRHGHRIRPFHATYNGERLCIQVNKLPNFNLNLYSKFIQGPKDYLQDLDFCDEDSFPERLEVYNVSYEKPDGIAYLRKAPCSCSTGCDVCELVEIPICLEPIDPVNGEFRVIPIEDTSDPDDPYDCCWERTTWSKCCGDHYGDPSCGCLEPVVVCINYLASACYNWDDCCIPDGVCPDLQQSVMALALSLFNTVCDCGCLNDIFGHYSMDMMLNLASLRSGSMIYAQEQGFQIFGSTRGAYEAFQHLKHYHNVHPTTNYMLG